MATHQANNRYIPNGMNDHAGEKFFTPDGVHLNLPIANLLKQGVNDHLETLRLALAPPAHLSQQCKEDIFIDRSDATIYTGMAGIAWLYLRLAKMDYERRGRQLLEKAEQLIEASMALLKRMRVPSFLIGEVGVLTVSILVKLELGKNFDHELKLIVDGYGVAEKGECPDEVLYGRSGYLYALLLLRKEVPATHSVITEKLLRLVVNDIIKSGKNTAAARIPFGATNPPPLVYFWHRSPYVGAAHGYVGILYMLLETIDLIDPKDLTDFIRPTIDFVCSLQFPKTGNFPSSVQKERDELVHWCHGSPGAIHLLIRAAKVFHDEKYLQQAMKAADDIWQRGLLLKGNGLCHGVAGNAYAFLGLLQATGDQKYLHRALRFGSHCCSKDRPPRRPDNPMSLYEGLAGTIWFLLDLSKPREARFPGFQLKHYC